MKRVLNILILLLCLSPALRGQKEYLSQIKIENQRAIKQGSYITVDMRLDIGALDIRAKQMITLTPILQSADGLHVRELSPIVINGNNRNKAFSRSRALNGVPAFGKEPQVIALRKKNALQTLTYSDTVFMESWMKRAELILKEEVSGCAQCGLLTEQVSLTGRLLPADFAPNYQLRYVTPEVELVKHRTTSHSARVHYKVGRSELLPEFADNATELKGVDKALSKISGDKTLTITEISIDGYASPEGNSNSNLKLSHRRANAFANYLSRKFGLSKERCKINPYGEDWKGLRMAVEASDMAEKAEILQIIDEIPNPDTRDVPLKRLSRGETYRNLLDTYYPALRCNVYHVSCSFVVKPFGVDEAKEIVRTNPRLLSLNEMFLVAQSYPARSKEFKETLDIAARLYPDNDIAILNLAAADIETGNMDEAITRMQKIGDPLMAWNNLGVAYARKGNPDKAKEFFTKAVAGGDENAAYNLKQLELYLEDWK